MRRNPFYPAVAATGVVAALAGCTCDKKEPEKEKTVPPNILVFISDDQSFPYASAYGCTEVSTPGFDFVASHGALFTQAYVTSPGSSPSRASILTGLYPWQIEEAGTHASSFPSRYHCYPDILEDAGYSVGYTGKGWGPGDWKVSGRRRNPAGTEFNELTTTPPYSGISKIDYAANFKKFLDRVPAGRPFCFWLGPNEPHRGYQKDSWKSTSHSLSEVRVPGYLPDADVVKGDILDYAVEIEWADSHLMAAIRELESRGLLENTLIVALADNGMAFPHAKANCYDAGLHVPLAVCWMGHIRSGQTISQEVSTIDLLPTFLDAAQVDRHYDYAFSGKTLLPSLTGEGPLFSPRPSLSGRERHSSARPGNLGYPIRSYRSGDYLLIWNFHPERWPAGDPQVLKEDGSLGEMHKAYFDIDGSPTLTYMENHREEDGVFPYFMAATALRNEFELYNVVQDPDCMKDLAGDKDYLSIFTSLKGKLFESLKETGDSRLGDNPEIWESYPRLSGPMRNFPI